MADDRRSLLHHAKDVYANVSKLDRWGGGGFSLSTVVKIAAWAGLLAVMAVLVSRLRTIEAQLDPVAHGVEKLQRDVDRARAEVAQDSERSRAELQKLAEDAKTLRTMLDKNAGEDFKAAQSATAKEQEVTTQLADLVQALDNAQKALKASSDSALSTLTQVNDALAKAQVAATEVQKGTSALSVAPARASLTQAQASADQLAKALDDAVARTQALEKKLAAEATTAQAVPPPAPKKPQTGTP